MSRRAVSWVAAVLVAAAAFLYGAVDEGPPSTNADRVRALAGDFACPVCAGQSVGESDVPVAREIRRQIAVWVDEGRSDAYIRDQLVAAYDTDIDYNPVRLGNYRPGMGPTAARRSRHRHCRGRDGETRSRRGPGLRGAACGGTPAPLAQRGRVDCRRPGGCRRGGPAGGPVLGQPHLRWLHHGRDPVHCPGEDLRGPAAALRRRHGRRHRRLRRSPGNPALQCGGPHLPGLAHVPPGRPGCCRAIPRRRGGGGSRLPRRPAVPGHCGPRGG